MKKRKHVYGLVVLLLTAILFQGCPPEEIKVPEEDKKATILNEKIEKAVTLEAVATLKKMGMPIHGGVQPPNIEGSYLADDITLKVCKNMEDCSPAGTKYNREKWTLKNQDNERFSVNLLVEYEDGTSNSYNMVISGEGNKFTLYSGQNKMSNEGNAYRLIDVYSGTMTENGLANVNIVTLWVEEGYNDAVMIYHEQDGMAEKFDDPLDPEKPRPEPGEKAGNVRLPQGAKVNFEKCSVISFSDKQKVTKKGDFVVGLDESEQLQQTVFMADENNKVLMLAYLNVGEEEIELSAESSAIGIFMMLTGARSQLDKEQWARTEELLKKTPKFAPVLAEVERLIKAGANLLSEDNTRLIELYGELLNSMAPAQGRTTKRSAGTTIEASGATSQTFTQIPSQRITPSSRQGTYQPFSQSSSQGVVTQSVPQTRDSDKEKDTSLPPLVITNEGSRIIINNNGMSPAYVITIEEEKENGKFSLVLTETLGVSKAANLGITDILTFKAGFFQPPSENVEYTMKTNTNYFILADSGLDEWNSASFENIGAAILYLADGLGLPIGSACVKTFAEQSYLGLKTAFAHYKADGLGQTVKNCIDHLIGIIGSGNVLECALGEGATEMLSKGAQFVLKGLDVLGKADGYGSLYGHFLFLLGSEPTIGFCRSTDGMDLNECGVPYLTVTTPLSIGTRVRLKCDRHACAYPAWIDLDNNDVKDPGEELKDGNNEFSIQGVEMKIHGDFAALNFEEMELTTLQLNPNSEVTSITAEKLKIFQGRECEHLKSLYTGKNLEKIDVRNCKGLEVLSTRSKLTELDLTGCKALEKLDCYKNELHTLDLRGLKELKEVDCYSNLLTKVQLGENDALVKLDLRHNRLDSTNIAMIVKNLPQRAKKDGAIIKLDGNTAVPSGNDYTSANLKNWKMTPAAGKITFTTAKPVGSTIRLKVTAQETNPYDVWVDLNGNGELDEGESFSAYGTAQEFKVARDTVTIYGGLLKVDCSNNEITWLEVNGCTTLQELRCNKNRIETLSIYIYIEKLKLLDCSDNLLKELYVSSPEITEVHCKNNPLTELEITGRKKLELLDLTNCTNLTKLKCSENNLKKLTLTGCNALETLNCDFNSLTALNISGLNALTKMECRNNELNAGAITKVIGDLPQRAEWENASAHFEKNKALPTEANIQTGNAKNWTITPKPGDEEPDDPLPEGDVVVLTVDELRSVDIEIECLPGREEKIWADWNGNGKKDAGEEVYEYGNIYGQPTAQTVMIHGASFITKLTFEPGKLTSLDVRKCGGLKELRCSNQKLTSLKVSRCTALEYLSCWDNQLTSLTVSGLYALRNLSCDENQLTKLDVSTLTALQSLSCEKNQLTDLNVSGLAKLQGLYCSRNKLTSLNLSGCTSLKNLYCDGNELTGTPPDIFDQIECLKYDIRYEYEWDKERKINVMVKDNIKGYWYPHEPGGGCHRPEPCGNFPSSPPTISPFCP